MSAFTNKLIAGGFLLVLCLPLLGLAFGVEPEAIENRELSERPRATLPGLFDSAFYRALTSYLIDTLPWRSHAVSAAAWLDLKVFHDSPNPKVHIGRKGWLFLDSSIRLPCVQERKLRDSIDVTQLARNDDRMAMASVEAVVERLRRTAALVEESGREFRLLITPNKHSIYPEFLNGTLQRLARCSDDKRDELRRLLEVAPPAGYIDLFDRLATIKRNRSRLLYFPNDSHLSSLGATVLAAEIVDSLRPGLWDSGSMIHLEDREHTGDLTRMLGFPSTVPSDRYAVRRKGARLIAEQPVELPGGAPLRRFRTVTQDAAVLEERTLIIHDSQMNRSMQMLGMYFADITFLNINTFTPEIALPLIRDSQVVIIQSVERGVYHRTARQFGSNKFLESLELVRSRP